MTSVITHMMNGIVDTTAWNAYAAPICKTLSSSVFRCKMVTCSICKEDLSASRFSNSQRRKGPKSRKCRTCIDQKKRQKKPSINTENIIFNYYQNLLTKSNKLIKHQIACIIVEYAINSQFLLNGVYEDMDIHHFQKHKGKRETVTKRRQLDGNLMILYKNLTFKWIICRKSMYHLPHSALRNLEMGYPSETYHGLYKVFNGKRLLFEVFDFNGRSIKMHGEIVYESTDDVSIKINDRNAELLLPRVQIKDCKLLSFMKGKEGYPRGYNWMLHYIYGNDSGY